MDSDLLDSIPNAHADEVDASAAVARLAGRLIGELARHDPGRNIVCSPLVAWLPLAALVNVTRPSLRGALLDAIGLDPTGTTLDGLNAAASAMLNDLDRNTLVPVPVTDANDLIRVVPCVAGEPSLRLAGGLWVDRRWQINPDFACVFADAYHCAAEAVSFADPASVVAINRWAAERTDGLITDLVQRFDALTSVVIAHAIHFRGVWEWEFDPGSTQPDVFHAPEGDMTAPFMRFGSGIPGWWEVGGRRRRMESTGRCTYFEDDDMQAVDLRFTTTREGLLVLLPSHDSPETLLADPSRVRSALAGAISTPGELRLPRFRLDAELDLSDVLVRLGVPLFDKAASPLSDLIVDAKAVGAEPVTVSAVRQRAIMEVDERGTTAAAAGYTAATAGGIGPSRDRPFAMVCDRPFAVVLYSDSGQADPVIIMCGVVNQPEAWPA